MRLRDFTDTLSTEDWIRVLNQQNDVLHDGFVVRYKFRKLLGGYPIRKKFKRQHEKTKIPITVVIVDDSVHIRRGREVDVRDPIRGFYYCPECQKHGIKEELRYILEDDKYMCTRCLTLFKKNKKGEWRAHTINESGNVVRTVPIEGGCEKISRFYGDENA